MDYLWQQYVTTERLTAWTKFDGLLLPSERQDLSALEDLFIQDVMSVAGNPDRDQQELDAWREQVPLYGRAAIYAAASPDRKDWGYTTPTVFAGFCTYFGFDRKHVAECEDRYVAGFRAKLAEFTARLKATPKPEPKPCTYEGLWTANDRLKLAELDGDFIKFIDQAMEGLAHADWEAWKTAALTDWDRLLSIERLPYFTSIDDKSMMAIPGDALGLIWIPVAQEQYYKAIRDEIAQFNAAADDRLAKCGGNPIDLPEPGSGQIITPPTVTPTKTPSGSSRSSRKSYQGPAEQMSISPVETAQKALNPDWFWLLLLALVASMD